MQLSSAVAAISPADTRDCTTTPGIAPTLSNGFRTAGLPRPLRRDRPVYSANASFPWTFIHRQTRIRSVACTLDWRHSHLGPAALGVTAFTA